MSSPGFINLIGSRTPRIRPKRPGEEGRYRVTITDLDAGEVIYDWESKGGVLCSVEEGRAITGGYDGTQQVGCWGDPMVWIHAFNMLGRFIRSDDDHVEALFAAAAESGVPERDLVRYRAAFDARRKASL